MKRLHLLALVGITAASVCLPGTLSAQSSLHKIAGRPTSQRAEKKRVIGKAKINNAPVYAQGEPPYGRVINHLYKEQKVIALSPCNAFGMIPVIVVLPYEDGQDYEDPIPASDFFAPEPEGYVRAKDIKGLPKSYYKLPPKPSAPQDEEPSFIIPVTPIPNAAPPERTKNLWVRLTRPAQQKRHG